MIAPTKHPFQRMSALRPGFGRAHGHCGELLQGRLGPDGPVALVTLPWPDLVSRAWFAPAQSAPLLVRVRGPGEHEPDVAKRAARAAQAALGRAGIGGRLVLSNPAPVGGGAGSSSMDALISIRAVAAAFGARFEPEWEAALAHRAEGAVDPLMYDAPVLFASRQARKIALLPPAPKLLAVGGFDGPSRQTAAASPSDLDVTELATRLARAFAARDLREIGAVATASAEADQALHPKPHWAEIKALAVEVRALGVAASHSGPAVALLLPPDADTRARRAVTGLMEIGVARAQAFRPYG